MKKYGEGVRLVTTEAIQKWGMRYLRSRPIRRGLGINCEYSQHQIDSCDKTAT